MASKKKGLTQERKVTITPDMAKDMLESNTDNRKLSPVTYKRLARAICRGEWKYNCVPIIFSDTGKLLDGQHRLMACFEANRSIVCDIIWDATEDVFDTIDINRVRTLSDILNIGGKDNTNTLAPTLRLVHSFYDNGFNKICGGSGAITSQQAEGVLDQHPNVEHSVSVAMASKRDIKGMLSPALYATIHYILSDLNPGKADEFLTYLKSGANLPAGSPVLALRKLLFLKCSDRDRRAKFVLMFKAWNAFVSGKSVGHFKSVTAEKLPKLNNGHLTQS